MYRNGKGRQMLQANKLVFLVQLWTTKAVRFARHNLEGRSVIN